VTWEGFDNDDLALFERVARSLHRSARGLMEDEDLYQGCALWALENKAKYLAAKDESEAHVFRLLRSRMQDHIRQEKAKVGGYEPEDQYMYSPKVLKKIIPLAFDPTWMVSGQDYDKDKVSRGGDHSDPADAWVLVADVKRVFPKLRDQDRLLLYRTLVGAGEYGLECQKIAAEAGTTPARVQTTVHHSLKRLGRLLRDD